MSKSKELPEIYPGIAPDEYTSAKFSYNFATFRNKENYRQYSTAAAPGKTRSMWKQGGKYKKK